MLAISLYLASLSSFTFVVITLKWLMSTITTL